ncbi:hypothetical protein KGF56_003362 [Candida oxycetoniae]|uniref:GTP-binding protein YPT7 n=1 Tax=Candida oxycetoniae TaxID=497107 RepID=A0AAI9SVW7_9ASCO|nr:uncharacterized protein KGF56_003362 [Candida oxycetoniae]KAI3403932.2 hypothetical protein KGF56_003362 [Candida oxycetoniae]
MSSSHHHQQVPTLKIVLLGDSGVGKTCLRSQFVHHVFTNSYKATIGGDYLTTTIELPREKHIRGKTVETTKSVSQAAPFEEVEEVSENNSFHTEKINLQIWDTAGQERFNSISSAFYRGTDICILCYDITNYESVLSLRDWFGWFIEHCRVANPGVIIVGNKLDKSKNRVVDKEEIKDILPNNATKSPANVGDYICNWDTDVLEVSAKQLDKVKELFVRAATLGRDLHSSDYMEHRRLQNSNNIIDLHQTIQIDNKSKCAC